MNRRPTVRDRFRHRYGAHPLHLLLMACCFALASYAAVRLLSGRTLEVALWFIGGALVHDLVLVPLYSGADRAAQATLGPRPGEACRPARAGFVNHVRVPAFLSLLLLLVWFPLVLDLSDPYTRDTGLSESVYLGRWLLVTAVLFGISALLLVARALFAGRAVRRSPAPPDAPPSDGPPPGPSATPGTAVAAAASPAAAATARAVAPAVAPVGAAAHRGPVVPARAGRRIRRIRPVTAAALATAAGSALVLAVVLARRASCRARRTPSGRRDPRPLRKAAPR
ncbi:hypothetical protein [Kitasatospora sp. NBC_00315]|uniref:hypothetical protein n=1 Tax=Kitasatospora sp. NBC_00315 TaxID=2975963 RepID=UPI00325015CE